MKRLLSLLAALLLAAGITCLPAAQASADLMNENGILRYYDYYGRQAVRIGVDVSFYNNQVDWEALKMQGIDFAIIRLGGRGWGTGQIYDDRQTQWNLISAHDAGLDVGAYFYSTAVNATEAVEEAEASLMKLNGMTLQLPLFIAGTVLFIIYIKDIGNGAAYLFDKIFTAFQKTFPRLDVLHFAAEYDKTPDLLPFNLLL